MGGDDDGPAEDGWFEQALRVGFTPRPAERPAVTPALAGCSLGGYRLLSELGSGGMGRVYLAEKGGERLALKVVHPHLLEAPGFFKRFLREAEIGKTIRHPNVVRTLDCDQVLVDGAPHAFIVMEYVEGQTLRGLLEELARVPEELCRHVGREVAKGLAAIHGAGAVHRDLKPENVLITRDHVVKVMDLGVARVSDETLRLSRSGAFVGSAQYASPEQFRGTGHELDGRSDLYSLGVILYELSCGEHPHPGDSFLAVLAKVVTEEPRRLGERNPQLSAFFEEVVHTLLSKDRAKRFGSAAELLAVLTDGEKGAWWPERAKAIRAATRRPLRRIRIPRETAIYGRDMELAKLTGLYEAAKTGDGRVLLLEGEAGIGKTRLVDEFVGQLAAAGEDLHFLFGSYPPGGAATASGAWSTAYREQFGDEGLEASLAAYLTAAPALIPAFAALLRGEPGPAGKAPLTKDGIHALFTHATRALARERVTVVLIEDLHFAPEEGRALFAALAQAVPEHRILLVGTTRPGLPEPWIAGIARLPQTSRLELPRLGPKDLVRLLVDAFRSRHLAEELSARIAVKSDGNPFFVFEIIRGLKEGQFIARQPDGTWATTKVIGELTVPSSVLDLVKGRISGLDAEDRDLLDVASCCGFSFDPTLVAEAAGVPRVAALKRLGQIERRHRLVRSAGRLVEFDHHQVQEALYGSLLGPLKEEYHAAIAEALSARHPEAAGAAAVDLCRHWLEAGRGARALPHFGKVFDHLERNYLFDPLAALAERALAEPGLLTGAARLQVLVRLAGPNGSLDRMGRRQRQEEACREAMALAREIGDRDSETRAAYGLGVALLLQSRNEETLQSIDRCLLLARETGDWRMESSASGIQGIVFGRLGRRTEQRASFERSLAIGHEHGDRAREGSGENLLGNLALSLGRFAEAAEHYGRLLVIARETGDRRGESVVTGNLGLVLCALGRYAEAREHHERGLALAREIGDCFGEVVGEINLAGWCVDLGRGEEAMARIERRLAVARSVGAREPESHLLHIRGSLAESMGDVETAYRMHEGALALRRATGIMPYIAESLADLALLDLERGDSASAAAHAEEALALAREANHPHAALFATIARASLPGGDASAPLSALAEYESRITWTARMRARFGLYRLTGDRAHLAEAKRLLDLMVEHAPADCREPMLANVRLHREIPAAAREAGLGSP